MISNQILQNTIDGIKSISRVDLCVIDGSGKVVAKTFEESRTNVSDAVGFINSQAESQTINGCHFFKVMDDKKKIKMDSAKNVGSYPAEIRFIENISTKITVVVEGI